MAPRGFAQSRLRHRLADAINLALIEARQLYLSAMRRLDQIARLLHRHEVFIN